MHTISFLGRQGHSTITYDVLDEAALIAAKAQFDATFSQGGMVAFAVRTPGAPAEQIMQFDPSAEEILVMAPMAGGAV